MNSIRIKVSRLLGFNDHEDFELIPYKETPPLYILRSEDGELSFLLADPFRFFDYEFVLSDEVEAALKIERIEDLLTLVLIRHSDSGELTANLLGPVLINLRTLQGTQVVLQESGYTTCHPLPAETKSAVAV